MSAGIVYSPVDLAQQRRYDAGLALRDARRAALADPFSCRNSDRIARATADVEAAQSALDALQQPANQLSPTREATR